MSEYINPRLEAIDERLALLTQVLQDQQTLTATHRLDSQERRLESNERMARVEEAIAQTLNVVQQLGNGTNARISQHDQELDDQDERTERLEKNHLEHASRMAKLEDIQADIKVMLQILLRRSIGDSGELG
jgi:exonuclease VII large subunit